MRTRSRTLSDQEISDGLAAIGREIRPAPSHPAPVVRAPSLTQPPEPQPQPQPPTPTPTIDLADLTASQYREWLTNAERSDCTQDGGITVDPSEAAADDQPRLGTLLDHLASETVWEIVGFRAGNATLQVCPLQRRIVTVVVTPRKDVDYHECMRRVVRFGSDT